MSSGKAMTIVVISLLAITLIFNSSSRFDVFAKPKLTRGPISCGPLINDDRIVRCCQTETDSAGLALTYCTFCDNTNPPSNCTPRTEPLREPPTPIPPKLPPSVVTTEPPSVAPPNGSSPTTPGAIEQPPSTVKDNATSAPSRSQRVFSPTDSANLAPDNNKNNNPPSTEDNKPKGSELGQSIGGGLSATKKGNKDNSPTPPPCPTDNSPIPPNCTLKPKF